ncbi:hypothetical protein LEP1GSC170_4462 [Leptospira interrogans serovar Bataviae str. HAI135]|nr:hypothetical protein LEP1GSC170_4462 [Leptospira interrogans serovar Bataviae str. HAI135]
MDTSETDLSKKIGVFLKDVSINFEFVQKFQRMLCDSFLEIFNKLQ